MIKLEQLTKGSCILQFSVPGKPAFLVLMSFDIPVGLVDLQDKNMYLLHPSGRKYRTSTFHITKFKDIFSDKYPSVELVDEKELLARLEFLYNGPQPIAASAALVEETPIL